MENREDGIRADRTARGVSFHGPSRLTQAKGRKGTGRVGREMGVGSLGHVVVVGNGPVGSASARALVERGASRVTVVDGTPVGVASSHSDRARLVRAADAEGDPAWSGRAMRSVGRFRELEASSGVPFFRECGALVLGPRAFSERALEAARRSLQMSPGAGVKGSVVQALEEAEVRRRWGYLRPDDGCGHGVWQALGAGCVDPQAMVRAHVAQGRRLAAERDVGFHVVEGEAVNLEVSADGGVRVGLRAGGAVEGDRVVVAGGAGSNSLVARSGLALDGVGGEETGVRVSRRAVVLAEVSEEVAHGVLGEMPTIKYAYDLGIGGGSGPARDGEQSRVEAGSVYILPPVLYPELGNRWFVKAGGGAQDFVEGDTAAVAEAVKQWMDQSSELSPFQGQAVGSIEATLRQLLGGVDLLGNVQVKRCMTTISKSGAMDVWRVRGSGGRAVVFGACQAKAAGPAYAIGEEVADALLDACP